MSEKIIINTNKQKEMIPVNYEILPVFDNTNPLLEQKMEYFNFADFKVDPSKIAGDLLATMRAYNGLGLSANQCGLSYRVFVMEPDIVCFNPRIISQGKMKKDKEGCLSFPGLWLHIERPEFIEVEFENVSGITKKYKFEGVTARCFMHELDHMNGIHFTSLVGKTSLIMATNRQKKFVKKMIRDKKNQLRK